MDQKIMTHTGVLFDPFNPDPALIRIEDIAHHLSHVCRYTGACNRFYSVGAHSLFVMRIIEERYPDNRELALWALLHDAAEAYLVDLPTPIKRHPQFAFYREMEWKVLKAIAQRFGLRTLLYPVEVKRADEDALCYEWAELMPTGTAAPELVASRETTVIGPWRNIVTAPKWIAFDIEYEVEKLTKALAPVE